MIHLLSKDTVSAAILIASAVILYVFLIPNYVADAGGDAMSPSFFPRIGAILIGAGGLALLLVSILSATHEQRVNDMPEGGGILHAALVVAAFAGFVLLFQFAGYIYAAPAFIAALMLVFGARSPLTVALVSAMTTGVLYVVFSYGLNLPLN